MSVSVNKAIAENAPAGIVRRQKRLCTERRARSRTLSGVSRIQLPSLVALRAFVIVGTLGSVRRAGQEMNVDHSSISRHIKALEERLGISLFRQEGRQLVLTEEGESYHRKIRRAFDLMTEATAELRINRRRSLAIFATPGFAHRKLLPNIPQLQQILPDWEIQLHTDLGAQSSLPDSIRVEIAFLDNPESTSEWTYELLAQPRLFPVVNPRVRASWVSISRPEELLELPAIRAEKNGLWDNWLHLNGIRDVPDLKGPNMPNMHLAIEAAIYGQGIALTNEVLVEDAIRAGDLVEIMNTDTRFFGYYVSGPTHLWDSQPFRDLRTWLKKLSLLNGDPRKRPAGADARPA
ncbi:LysR family transcriptional regulator (plasmid) [Agrobacterium tumefaciens]|nr:LysR family transcriptional regulator [Agrobacterium tumefaciens]